jgi:DNA-binding response OmpR family regulator
MNDSSIDDGTFRKLLGDLRHDLKNPVGQVMGYAEMLAEDADSDKDQDFISDLKNISDAGERLLDLVNDLLGPGKVKPEDIDAQTVEFRIRIELDHILGYTEMLRELTEENEQYANAGDDLDTIEESADEFLTILTENLPMVLAAEAAESEPEPESAEKTKTAEPETGSEEDHPAGRSWLGEGGDILAIDDAPGNREMLRRRLERQGYTVHLGASGEECLEMVAKQKFDLILLDMMMPGIDGTEVLKRLKEDPVHRSIPVIMVSGADDTKLIVKCILLGADDYIFKPFNPVLLRARIGSSLEKARMRREQAPRLRVFVSSPGDVIPERRVVKMVIDRLNEEFSGDAVLIPIFWEEEPLLATETFQSQIISPRDTDIYVGIFWSRLGSILPDHIRRPDGTRYLSGSEFEFEDAMEGFRETGKPDIVIYQKMGDATVALTDREAVMERFDQKERLAGFVEQWFKSDDGESFIAAFHTFEDTEKFEDLLIGHLRKLVTKLVAERQA